MPPTTANSPTTPATGSARATTSTSTSARTFRAWLNRKKRSRENSSGRGRIKRKTGLKASCAGTLSKRTANSAGTSWRGLSRNSALKRGGPIKRKSKVRRISSSRQIDRRIYNRRRKAYIEAHPFCQIYIAQHRLNEAEVIRNNGTAAIHTKCSKSATRLYGVTDGVYTIQVPLANQIHHRNKADHERLLLEDYWMSAGTVGHRWAEDHKDEARKIGVLCPINARPDGSLPDGQRCLTTPELLEARVAGFDDLTIDQNLQFRISTIQIGP